MHRAKIAVCIRDREYRNRFVSCLMKHYRNQVELHIFDEEDEALIRSGRDYELYLVSGEAKWVQELSVMGPVVCLWDQREDDMLSASDENACQHAFDERRMAIMSSACDMTGDGSISNAAKADKSMEWPTGNRSQQRVYFVEKYQNVGRIMEEVLSHITAEIAVGERRKGALGKTRLMAVYSLSAVECQLPFAVTLGAILSDNQRVLLVDLQESSGISQIMNGEGAMGLEEMLLMAESGSFNWGRMTSCIGHRNGMDYIYPAASADTFYEVGKEGYIKLFTMLSQEMDYDVIVVNFGTRFPGFLEILGICSPIYLIHSSGQIHKWREREFLSEIEAKGYQGIGDSITHVEMPSLLHSVTSMDRLVEEWKWGNLGDIIRRMTSGVASDG
ncbi:MAG: hypothetical protein LIO37_04435 [Clostridiales bacterium]|nr:hypothetical protein [Clostridiales bacterium]